MLLAIITLKFKAVVNQHAADAVAATVDQHHVIIDNLCEKPQSWRLVIKYCQSTFLKKMAAGHNNNDQELRTVFQMCQPNSEGLISLKKLQDLFRQHDSNYSSVS